MRDVVVGGWCLWPSLICHCDVIGLVTGVVTAAVRGLHSCLRITSPDFGGWLCPSVVSASSFPRATAGHRGDASHIIPFGGGRGDRGSGTPFWGPMCMWGRGGGRASCSPPGGRIKAEAWHWEGWHPPARTVSSRESGGMG